MDIYSIGEEKRIDGVWGRVVGKRFYDSITSVTSMPSEGGLSRKISIESIHPFYAVFVKGTIFEHEYMLSHPDIKVEKYKPKPIEHKRGDIVWVKIDTNFGLRWASTRYVGIDIASDGTKVYITTDMYMPDGSTRFEWTSRHKEVFLKPPFDF